MLCVGLVGVTGHLVEVEADLSAGLPAVVISGLPDTALHEARDRVRAAVVNSGQRWPNRRITLNLLPATLPKFGSAFDLAIAAALLGGSGELPLLPLEGVVVLGELGLDGTVRPVRGALPMVAAAAQAGVTRVIVPVGNAVEAAVIPGVRVRAVDTLHRLVAFVRDGTPLIEPPADIPEPQAGGPDLADVAGQQLGRRALEVAAAGGHHVALLGPPGAGKTMLAERLPSILPELDDDAALEVTALHSVAGLLPPGGRLLRRPPFQAPHHTATVPSLVGGGSGLARPGAVSLAHRGVLFLDEAPEFSKGALEALRQPLEHGRIQLSRSGGGTVYPARTQLVLAANPCPCAKPGRRCALRVFAAGSPPLPGKALRAAARPDRRPGAPDAGAGGRADGDRRRCRALGDRRRPGGGGPAGGGRPLGRPRPAAQRRGGRPTPAPTAVATTGPGHRRAAGPARLRLAVGARLRPGDPDGLDHR